MLTNYSICWCYSYLYICRSNSFLALLLAEFDLTSSANNYKKIVNTMSKAWTLVIFIVLSRYYAFKVSCKEYLYTICIINLCINPFFRFEVWFFLSFSFSFFFNWHLLPARLNSHYEDGVTRKVDKRLQDTENLFRKNVQLKDVC